MDVTRRQMGNDDLLLAIGLMISIMFKTIFGHRVLEAGCARG